MVKGWQARLSLEGRGGIVDNRGSTGNLGLYVLDEDLRKMGVCYMGPVFYYRQLVSRVI